MKLNIKNSFDERTDKSMRTWIQLVRTFQKIRAYELIYINQNALSMNQFEVLEVLYHRGDMPVSTITKLISSTPGNVTVVIKNLQRDKFVEINAGKNDKRERIVGITPLGKEKIALMFERHSQNLKQCFEALSDEEMDALFVSLRKIHKTKLKDI
ncbi:MAG: MarR family transcriptional regulator [Campylobacteraceae bacterium]|jgi:MarR family 2-MHQ and catechol resistance regulon transcriptional repressor|nr:MarR family transcriptional regulator [Campylobacteraceae bacterium]